MSVGLADAGFKVIGAIEINSAAARTYKLNHPKTRLWQIDIAKARPAVLMRELGLAVGELTLLGGCPPCQGFSTLRTMNGSRRVIDTDKDLLFSFLRIALAMRPQFVLMENVPALARDRRLKLFSAALKDAGYSTQCEVIDAASFGVAQRRRRMIFTAARPPLALPVATPCPPRTVRDAIGHLPAPGKTNDTIHNLPERRSQLVAERIRHIPKNGGSRAALPARLQLACHRKSSGFKDVYGRMAWDKPAPTITTGCFNPSKGRFLHPTLNRGITMREAALLQGFPRSYRFPAELGRVTLATLIGNALPPPLLFAHASAILACIPKKRTSRLK